MAGIGTVTSAGKTAMALQNIDQLAKTGQTVQARNSTLWLQNELSKMKLASTNRELQQQTKAYDQAQADLAKAQQNLNTLQNKHTDLKIEAHEPIRAGQFREGIIKAGPGKTPEEQLLFNQVLATHAGIPVETWNQSVTELQEDSRLLDWIKQLDAKPNKTPGEQSRLWMMQMALANQLEHVDPALLGKDFD